VALRAKNKQFSNLALLDYLQKIKKWNLVILQYPEGIHFGVTESNETKVEQFAEDIKEFIQLVRRNIK